MKSLLPIHFSSFGEVQLEQVYNENEHNDKASCKCITEIWTSGKITMKWGKKIKLQSCLMKHWEGIIRQQPFWETAERSSLAPRRSAAPLRLCFGTVVCAADGSLAQPDPSSLRRRQRGDWQRSRSSSKGVTWRLSPQVAHIGAPSPLLSIAFGNAQPK